MEMAVSTISAKVTAVVMLAVSGPSQVALTRSHVVVQDSAV
jgi:hypothetical protein